MKRLLQLVTLAAVAVLLAPSLQAQRTAQQRPNADRTAQQRNAQRGRAQQGQAQGQGQRRGQQFRPMQPGGRRAGPVHQMQRLSQMSPEDRRAFLRNLPPRQREQVMRRLQHWNSLSDEQRREMLRREQVLEDMTPDQRQRVRQLWPQWQQLPQERRQAIQRRLRALAPLSEEERRARLADERFLEGLDESERALLRELAELRLPPPDSAQDPPPPKPDAPPPELDSPPAFGTAHPPDRELSPDRLRAPQAE